MPGYTQLLDVTARDSFLKNPDLVAMTFSHLKNDKDSNQCLFDAALTCKDFLEFLGASTETVARSAS